jgi:hypothetical protein
MRKAIFALTLMSIGSSSLALAGEPNSPGFLYNQNRAYGGGNLVNPRTGEVMVPTGPNFTGTRDGTVYVPAGPHGVIDTRNGRYVPTN